MCSWGPIGDLKGVLSIGRRAGAPRRARILVALKSARADGTSHLVLEPLELLKKLAALTPRPRVNLVLYHGVLASHATWRRLVVPADDERLRLRDRHAGRPERGGKPRYWAWADLMRRAFDLDVLACPRCGRRMRLLATIEDPRVIQQIPAHLGLPTEPAQPDPPRPPPAPALADVLT